MLDGTRLLRSSPVPWQAPMYQKHNTTVKASKKKKNGLSTKKDPPIF